MKKMMSIVLTLLVLGCSTPRANADEVVHYSIAVTNSFDEIIFVWESFDNLGIFADDEENLKKTLSLAALKSLEEIQELDPPPGNEWERYHDFLLDTLQVMSDDPFDDSLDLRLARLERDHRELLSGYSEDEMSDVLINN